MAKEYKTPQSTCQPDSDTVNSGLSREVFPSPLTTPKKSAWNKPSPHEVGGGIVMGADSWPTLSESARASPKSPSTHPTKSLISSQGIELGSSSSGFRSLTQKSASVNSGPTRQRSMKRAGAGIGDGHGAGGSGSSTHANMTANGFLSPEASYQGPGKKVSSSPLASGSVGESVSNVNKDGGQRVGSHGRNEQQQLHHNGSSRNNNGPQIRENGPYHHNNAGRRDPHRGFNNKGNNGHGPLQRGLRPFTHGSALNTQYYFYQLPYPAMPPYLHPEMTPYFCHSSLDPWRPPMTPILQPIFVPVPNPELPLPSNILNQDSELSLPPKILKRDTELPVSPKILKSDSELRMSPKMLKQDPELPLHSKILNQIDYYFSLDNLVKDTYLRKNMDAQGWVPINLIAKFNKVIDLTDSVQDILDAIKSSSIIEVQDNKVRCKEDWKRWVMSSSKHSPPTSPHSNPSSSSQNSLTYQLNHLNLE